MSVVIPIFSNIRNGSVQFNIRHIPQFKGRFIAAIYKKQLQHFVRKIKFYLVYMCQI